MFTVGSASDTTLMAAEMGTNSAVGADGQSDGEREDDDGRT